MTRRGLLIAGAACVLRADDTDQIWDLFTEMASALSDAKPEEFMRAFDRGMVGYEALRTEIEALLLGYEVHTSIELLNEDQDPAVRTIDLDWFLQIVEKQDTAGVTRRREQVRCRLVKEKKNWRITSLEPRSLFAPPKLTR